VDNPKKVLSDVPEPQMAFWFNNGVIAKNIYEFVSAIESCDKAVFDYHSNSEKNDFYNWILGVLGDDVLAKRIKKELDQKKFAKKIRRRIKELEKL
jgi:NAD+--asparagine ADP-ribosyltransferase